MQIAVNLVLYIALMSFTPGPNNLICLTQGSKFGFTKALPYVFGIMVGCITQMWLLLFIGVKLEAVLPTIIEVISWIGAAYMLWLAYKCLFHTSDIKENDAMEKPLGFTTGAILQYANPKAYAYNTTLISAYILPMGFGLAGSLAISVATGLFCFLGPVAWICFGRQFSRLFETHAKTTNYIMAGTLVYLAVTIVLH